MQMQKQQQKKQDRMPKRKPVLKRRKNVKPIQPLRHRQSLNANRMKNRHD
jgi:hypothetical protein